MKKQNKLELTICKYFEHCNVAKETGRSCNFPDYLKCRTYKFKEKYGDEPLGIGAMTIVPNELEGGYKN